MNELATELVHNPDADPRDLGGRDLDSLRQYLLADKGGLFAFCWLIFEYTDLKPELHGEICNLIGMWKRPDDPEFHEEDHSRLMIQIPREFFKTSVCTRANALWQICRGFYTGQDDAVVIFNERLENTAKWIRAIKEVVYSSKTFQVLFKDMLPPGVHFEDTRSMPKGWKWSDVEINFQRNKAGFPEASITGVGVGAAATGGHWPTIIKDDIISIEARESPTVMEKAKEWFDASFYLERPAMRGRDLVVCTPWSYDDVYTYALGHYNYTVYRRSALEGGHSIFPEKLSTEELVSFQSRQPILFSAQMQCQPKPGEEMNFLYEWLGWGNMNEEGTHFVIEPEHYDASHSFVDEDEPPPRRIPLNRMTVALLFDPAPSEQIDKNRERNARNAIIVEGYDPWGRRHILDTLTTRKDPLDVLESIFQLCDKWGTNIVAIEEVNFSKLYRPMLQMYNRLHNKNMHLRFIRLETEKRSKDTRITALIPKFRSGQYYVNRAGTEEFIQEFVEYPYSRTRDLMDALAYDDRIPRPETDYEYFERRKRAKRQSSTKDPWTGY